MTMGEGSVLALDLLGVEADQAHHFGVHHNTVPRTVPFRGRAGAGASPTGFSGEALPFDGTLPVFDQLEVAYDKEEKILWQYMKPQKRPSFTMALLEDMRRFLAWAPHFCAKPRDSGEAPVRYLVLASKMPGIFNLGGDLPCFVSLIRAGDREGLRRYAHACIDVQHARSAHIGLPVTTISLVQGDALGGGFEAALADDVIVAERSAKLGLPEILFNLFPGMGAYSFLARRLDAVRAERLIMGGRIYGAEELHEMGLVDTVAEDGRGEDAICPSSEHLGRFEAVANGGFGASGL